MESTHHGEPWNSETGPILAMPAHKQFVPINPTGHRRLSLLTYRAGLTDTPQAQKTSGGLIFPATVSLPGAPN